ncbi:S-adenosyl-L-methionine-dependent methyltransferase [Xylariaceae sp. FL0255]|nr:S-adenosyl-L-methionine-dependent methyltransferase [Xylariaceae sp. FL0255]
MGDHDHDGGSLSLAPSGPVRAELNAVEQTMLLTLYMRARDAARPNPILGDPHAQKILNRVNLDDISPTLFPSDQRFERFMCTRGRGLDKWCQLFLDSHAEEAVTVLHLACGLDLRVMRIERPAGSRIRWIEIDKPQVVNLRERLVPDPEQEKELEWDYRLIGASVVDESWMSEIPSDRPLLLIAEGLFPYLTQQEITSLLRRLVDHVPSGWVATDTVGSLLTRFQHLHPLFKKTKIKLKWGVDDGNDIAAAHPRLQLMEAVRFNDLLPGLFGSQAPPSFGSWTPLLSLFPSWKTYSQMLRLEF